MIITKKKITMFLFGSRLTYKNIQSVIRRGIQVKYS